jgi:hypothetical protein
MEQVIKTDNVGNNGVTVNTAAYFMVLVSIVAVVAMGYMSKYLVRMWGESVGEMSYQIESMTMQDLCENKYSSRDSLMKELKVDEDGKQYDAYTFTCTYRSYIR